MLSGKDLGLTGREQQITELLARGLRDKEIAASLNIGERTVQHHLKSLYRKLEVTNRTGAVARVLQNRTDSRSRTG